MRFTLFTVLIFKIGQTTLPSSCPACEHTPVSADDCKPNKALRTTIKAFLRTEEKKREALRQKEIKDTPPATLLEIETGPLKSSVVTEHVAESESAAEISNDVPIVAEAIETEGAQDEASIQAMNTEKPDQAEEDIPQPSIEVCPATASSKLRIDANIMKEIAPGQESTAEGDIANGEVGSDEKDDKDAEKTQDGEVGPGAMAGFGFDATAMGGFPMGFGGDVNPMQQQMMMMMQNGMGSSGFGNFPMMGKFSVEHAFALY